MIYPYIDGDPVVKLDVKSNDNFWYTIPAYVDSGAAYSVFSKQYAVALKLNLQQGKKVNLTVGNGQDIIAYVHRLPVKFAEKEFLAEISFSPDLGVNTNIIGMKFFFDNFQICFNNKKRHVEVNTF